MRVHAASVNIGDWYDVTGRPYVGRTQMGLRKPKSERLGVDYAGTVEAVGKNVTSFDRATRCSAGGAGRYAEYVCRPRGARDRAEADERDLRGSGGGAGRGAHRAAGAPRPGAASSRGRRS